MFIHPEASVRWFYFERSQGNSCGGFSFLIKLQTPSHVFSFEFCEIKNIYFVEKLRTAASEHRIYIFFFVLILRQNRYLPLNSDHLLGKKLTMLRHSSQPSKISYHLSGDVFYFLPVLKRSAIDSITQNEESKIGCDYVTMMCNIKLKHTVENLQTILC